MAIDESAVRNPVLDCDKVWVRDPAILWMGDRLRCFHTAAGKRAGGGYSLFVDYADTSDLVHWTAAVRLFGDEPVLNFSSPGNVFRVGDEWVMCVQSYPIDPGEIYGSDASRLWLTRSRDLANWSRPVMIAPEGCRGRWAKSPRQIDPYVVEHDGKFWCFYKADGCIGLIASDDLANWDEASMDRPVLSRDQTPDGKTVENPCVIRDDAGRFVMFFAPCRTGRGIGYTVSDDLLSWRDVQYLDFPVLAWAAGGPTAAMVIDLRPVVGSWLMAFHGDRDRPHGAALGMAFSDDLVHWRVT